MWYYVTDQCHLFYGRSCFIIIYERKSWHDANNNCTIQGGRLAEIHDAYLNQQLKQALDGTWIIFDCITKLRHDMQYDPQNCYKFIILW